MLANASGVGGRRGVLDLFGPYKLLARSGSRYTKPCDATRNYDIVNLLHLLALLLRLLLILLLLLLLLVLYYASNKT